MKPINLAHKNSMLWLNLVFSTGFYLFILEIIFQPLVVWGQITPDATLPNNSIVKTQLNTNLIEGGTKTGNNLFHSFKEFSLPTGNIVFFNNSPEIKNIFTRVTGGGISNIDGLLKNNSSANLFLLNPNGIIFGPSASLNIGGSFIATTANSIKFADGIEFSAIAPNTPSLLTINVPIGLQFGTNPGTINVQGIGNNLNYIPKTEIINRDKRPSGLQVPIGQTLALVGGDINLSGGNITAPSGRIELGSVGSGSYVNLTEINPGWQLGYSEIKNWQNINFTAAASADVSGTGGGNIQIQAKQFNLADVSIILNQTTGSNNSGKISITTTDSIEIAGTAKQGPLTSGIYSDVQPKATGRGSNIIIETKNILLKEGGRITTNTFGIGDSGFLTIKASDTVEAIGNPKDGQIPSGLFADSKSGSSGKAGNLTIETSRLLINNGGRIGASSSDIGDGGNVTIKATNSIELNGTSPDGKLPSNLFTGNTGGKGKAGNLTIETPNLTVKNGAAISAATNGEGNGGDITIKAANFVEIFGTTIDNKPTNVLANTRGKGKAGNLTIETPRLTVKNGGRLTVSTAGEGDGGNLSIKATNSVELFGVLADGKSSGLFADTGGTGKAGNLTIETSNLTIGGGATIATGTLGAGDGGNLTIKASDRIQISDTINGINSGLFANAFQGYGNGGNLQIITDKLILRNGARIDVSTFDINNKYLSGTGAAGDLEVKANFIFLDNKSIMSAATTAGNRSNINLLAENIFLRRGSLITTDASVNANGGNITVNTDNLVLLENSNITANAIKGRGGNIFINTQGIFVAPNSKITATSEYGVSGDVTINTPDVEPSKGLYNLSNQMIDISRLIVQACNNKVPKSSFYMIGKGGLPASPLGAINTLAAITDLGEKIPQGKVEARGEKISNINLSIPIVEANGWEINQNGKIALVDNSNNWLYYNSWLMPTSCRITE